MKTVGCGLLGAGWWATTSHLPALKRHPRARVLAVQSLRKEDAERVARDFDAGRGVATVEELVSVKGIEAVVDASTPNMHYHNARTCLEHGLHVLTEKPMTLTAEQSGELVELARRKKLHLMIGCPWHFTEHALAARQLIREGVLGKLKLVSVLFTNFSGGLYRSRTWRDLMSEGGDENYREPYVVPELKSYSDPSICGGGQIFCQVSHAAAFLGFLGLADPAEVFARFDSAEIAIDVYDALNIRLRDDCLVSLASTGDTMLSDRQFELRIFGTEGMILMELWKGTLEFHPRKGGVRIYPKLQSDEIYPMYQPSTNLVDLVLGLASNGSPGELGHYAMTIIDAACRSAKSGENVKIDHRK